VSLDYWNIKISDLVTNLSADKLLRDEADCRIRGDLTSPTCADAISRITRFPDNALNRPGEIKSILVNPINAATTSVDGIDISGSTCSAPGVRQLHHQGQLLEDAEQALAPVCRRCPERRPGRPDQLRLARQAQCQRDLEHRQMVEHRVLPALRQSA
jgi:hypothetical protein